MASQYERDQEIRGCLSNQKAAEALGERAGPTAVAGRPREAGHTKYPALNLALEATEPCQ